jgi:hypothetical protein
MPNASRSTSTVRWPEPNDGLPNTDPVNGDVVEFRFNV